MTGKDNPQVREEQPGFLLFCGKQSGPFPRYLQSYKGTLSWKELSPTLVDAHFLSFCILVEEMHRASGRACPLRAMGRSMERNSQNVFLASRLLSWREPPESISFTVLWATGSLESVFLGVEKPRPSGNTSPIQMCTHSL